MTGPDQYMPQKSIPGIFPICFHLKRLHQPRHRLHDGVGLLIFNQTGVHPDDPMALFLIDSRISVALPVRGDHTMNFIPVMIRVLHADDRLHPAKST